MKVLSTQEMGTFSRISTPGCAKALDQLKVWSPPWRSCLCPLLMASSRREDNGLVTAFREKPLLPHWINAGFYSLSQDVFDYLPEKGSLERDVFPALVEKGLLGGARLHPRFWRSVDTHKDLEESADFIQFSR